MQINILQDWRQQAPHVIQELQTVADTVYEHRAYLDNHYPNWMEADEAAGDDLVKHEARRFFFVTLKAAITNAQLSYLFFANYLCDPEWWVANAKAYNEATVHKQVEEFGRTIRWRLFHMIAMFGESTIKSIMASAPNGTFKTSPSAIHTKDFFNLCPELLAAIGCLQFQGLFDLVRETRNTLHTNGIFRPRRGGDTTIEYAGKKFDFRIGKDSEWFRESFISWLAARVDEAMFEIVTRPIVAQIPFCSRVY